MTDVQVQNAGSVEQLRPLLKALVRIPGFDRVVVSVGVVRDADASAPSAAQSVRDALGAAGLAVPPHAATQAGSDPKTSLFVMPNNAEPGMLETLCLRWVANDPAFACIDDFFDCVRRTSTLPSNMDKARVQAFLSSRPELKRLLGEAAHAGYWNWDHAAFDDLKAFLRSL